MFLVSFSGNSGAGKSTLIRTVAEHLRPFVGENLRLFDETYFHHPYLARMFQDPKNWAFPIQINFLLQRAVTILRIHESETAALVLMERSIEEDELFFSYHEKLNNIPTEVRVAYNQIRSFFIERTPKVACHVFLDGPTELLVQRVEERTRQSRSGKELTGPPLFQYISDLNEIYDEWATRTRTDPSRESIWIDGADARNPETVANAILTAFEKRMH